VKLPEAGSKLVLVDTIPLNRGGDLTNIDNVSIREQGIAWDRSRCGDFYGIIRTTGAEEDQGIVNKVTVSRVTAQPDRRATAPFAPAPDDLPAGLTSRIVRACRARNCVKARGPRLS
jgi:hypothetical protein